MAESKAFDASKYLEKIKGKDYLAVKWRLVWLRHDHPHAMIETELVEHTDNPRAAVVKARITIHGGGSATGYKRQTAAGFGDYIEKAETGAIGRACAALGYGTQNTDDFDMDDQLVDSPVDRDPTGGTGESSARDDVMGAPDTTPEERTPPARPAGSTAAAIQNGRQNGDAKPASGVKMITDAQVRLIYVIGREIWKLTDGTSSEEHVAEMVRKAPQSNGKAPEALTMAEARALIDKMKARQVALKGAA